MFLHSTNEEADSERLSHLPQNTQLSGSQHLKPGLLGTNNQTLTL